MARNSLIVEVQSWPRTNYYVWDAWDAEYYSVDITLRSGLRMRLVSNSTTAGRSDQILLSTPCCGIPLTACLTRGVHCCKKCRKVYDDVPKVLKFHMADENDCHGTILSDWLSRGTNYYLGALVESNMLELLVSRFFSDCRLIPPIPNCKSKLWKFCWYYKKALECGGTYSRPTNSTSQQQLIR